MNKYYLCMEIGGTNLRYGLVDTNLHIVEFNKIHTSLLSESDDKGKFINDILVPYINQYGKENIICLSLALASLLDKNRRVIYSSPNIKGFDNIPLAEMLEKKLEIPVVMERDVNISLLYDVWKREYHNCGIIIGVYIGTGLGNAMCIDGKIYKGHSGSSCELGHIAIPGINKDCGCGKKNCIELKACGRALAELAYNKYHCEVSEIFMRHGNEADVKEIVYMCAVATATEVTILDPEYVILGGGVVEMDQFPFEYFLDSVKINLRYPNPRSSLKVILASSDPDVGVLGAAIHASQLLT